LLGEFSTFRQQLPHLLEALQEALPQMEVALRKVRRDLFQQKANPRLRHGQNPFYDPAQASHIPRLKPSQKNA
jgi:hypothetical protein